MMVDLAFLFDVDNTLLDNDWVVAALHTHLAEAHGAAARERYFTIFEALRAAEGYADYLGALQRYRLETLHDPRVLGIANWLVDYPFAERLYPGAVEAVRHAAQWGPTVILSDGDAVFQPRKIARAGLWQLFEGRVMVTVHKEQALADVEHWYPARRYVVIDDKLRLLHAIKQQWGERVTTVFPRQGHYATDTAETAKYPPADIAIDRIGDLVRYDLADFLVTSSDVTPPAVPTGDASAPPTA